MLALCFFFLLGFFLLVLCREGTDGLSSAGLTSTCGHAMLTWEYYRPAQDFLPMKKIPSNSK